MRTHRRFSRTLTFCAMVLFLVAIGVPSLAQHQGHDMHGQDHEKEQKQGEVKKEKPLPNEPSPTPTPSPTPKVETGAPMSGHEMHGAPHSQPSPAQATPPANEAGHQNQEGRTNVPEHAGPHPVSTALKERDGSLLVMDGDDMGIVVGSNERNFISMGAMGSGTSLQPASTPMYMQHKMAGEWLLVFHYNAFVGVNHQGGPRGQTKFESANWFMPMAFRRVGPGTIQLRGMFSFEPFTFPKAGSPLLFQTGETYKGEPLIDRQHPHDLFMELSATYTVPLGERGTWFTYFGYPGEPALGPVAFMHRWSASENPSAPLTHHLQDSTHITFGVFTTGFTYRGLKLEGSIFNGREPDENRYDFEAHKWNSRSARLSYAPNKNWAMQVSYGFLRKPEALEPDTDIRRVTASVQYNKPFQRGNWASSIVWGRNHLTGGDHTGNLNGYTAETTVNFLDKNYVYSRLELVDKNELLRPEDRAVIGLPAHSHPVFRIGAFTVGGARDIWNSNNVSMAVGGDLTFYSMPGILEPLYGNRPVSYRLFLRVRPGRMKMGNSHSGHTMPSGTE